MTKETTSEDAATAAVVDHFLATAGLTVADEERAYFILAYPIIKESLQHLRIPEARNAEPILIYPADNRR